jgi:hypothetical protein
MTRSVGAGRIEPASAGKGVHISYTGAPASAQDERRNAFLTPTVTPL